MILTIRRIDGKSLISYVTNGGTGHQVVTAPVSLLRQRKRPVEAGGCSFGGSTSQIAKLAVAMIDARLSGCEPPTVPADMSCGDVTAAVRVVETLLDAKEGMRHLRRSLIKVHAGQRNEGGSPSGLRLSRALPASVRREFR